MSILATRRAHWLALFMDERGLTKAALARAAKLGPSGPEGIRTMLAGRQPRDEKLEAIARALSQAPLTEGGCEPVDPGDFHLPY